MLVIFVILYMILLAAGLTVLHLDRRDEGNRSE